MTMPPPDDLEPLLTATSNRFVLFPIQYDDVRFMFFSIAEYYIFSTSCGTYTKPRKLAIGWQKRSTSPTI